MPEAQPQVRPCLSSAWPRRPRNAPSMRSRSSWRSTRSRWMPRTSRPVRSSPTRCCSWDAPRKCPAVLEEHLSKDPRSRGHYLLGQAYAQMGNHEKARDNYEAAIRIYPDYAEAYNGLAVAYEQLGETDKAKQAMDKFRQLGWTQRLRLRAVREIRIDRSRRHSSAMPPFSTPTRAGSSTSVRSATRRNNSGCGLRHWMSRTCPADNRWRGSAAMPAGRARTSSGSSSWRIWSRPTPATGSRSDGFMRNCSCCRRPRNRSARPVRRHPTAIPATRRWPICCSGLSKNLPETVELARQAVQCRPSAPNYAMLSAACRANQDLAGARTAIDQGVGVGPAQPPIELCAMPSRRIRSRRAEGQIHRSLHIAQESTATPTIGRRPISP